MFQKFYKYTKFFYVDIVNLLLIEIKNLKEKI